MHCPQVKALSLSWLLCNKRTVGVALNPATTSNEALFICIRDRAGSVRFANTFLCSVDCSVSVPGHCGRLRGGLTRRLSALVASGSRMLNGRSTGGSHEARDIQVIAGMVTPSQTCTLGCFVTMIVPDQDVA